MSRLLPRPGAQHLRRLSLTFALVTLLAVALTGAGPKTGPPEAVGFSAKRLTQINQVVQRAMDAKDQISRAQKHRA